MRYDPLVEPDPAEWLALDEGERLGAILRAHETDHVAEARDRVHAAIHTTVETQLAEGHVRARAAILRLLDEGLDRHEALHAIGSAVAERMYATMQGEAFDAEEYDRDLDALSADSWHRMARER